MTIHHPRIHRSLLRGLPEAARIRRVRVQPEQPVYARLPRAPITGSPVPHLTSLYHFHRAGEYGDRKWPGNCGGNLIKDLLTYFKPAAWCSTRCRLGHLRATCARSLASRAWPGTSTRASTPATRRISPPARRSISSGHIRPTGGRSCTPTIPATCRAARRSSISSRRYGQFIRNCTGALKPGGKLAILMGDYYRPRGGIRAAGLPHQAPGLRRRASAALHRHHPLSATAPAAARKSTASSFIPGLHDVCMIFEKAN